MVKVYDMKLYYKEVISLVGMWMRNTKVIPAQKLEHKRPQQQYPNSPKVETAQVSINE